MKKQSFFVKLWSWFTSLLIILIMGLPFIALGVLIGYLIWK